VLLIIRGIIDDKGFINSYRDRIDGLINAADGQRQRLIEVISPIVGGLSEALWTDAQEHDFERLRSHAPLLRHALAIANGSGYRRRKVLNTIRRIRRRVTSVVQFRLRGPTIALIGMDGVGKSTIADLLTSELSRFNPVKRVYMGFGVEAMAAEGHVRRTHPRQISGRLRSKILLGAGRQLKFPVWRHTLQWKRFLSTWRHRRRGGVVIYDRYVYDQTIEIQRVGAIPLLEKLFAFVSLRIFPKPDFTFLLDLSPDVSYARKPEGDKTKLTTRRTAYIALAQKVKSIKVVSTNQDPQAVSRAIMSEVWMHTSR
jgi:thymidylate kinase